MSKKQEIESPTRRKFFKTAAAGSVGAGAAVAGLGKAAPAKAAQTDDHKASRYRLTAHVKQAYATARF